MILKNIRETIKAKIKKEHRVQEDRCEGFTDDWAAVGAEVESQMSNWAPTCATPRIQTQTPRNPDIGALESPPDKRIHSQETVTSFNFIQMATRLRSFLDSDSQTRDGAQEVAVGVTLDHTVTRSILLQLTHSIRYLESP